MSGIRRPRARLAAVAALALGAAPASAAQGDVLEVRGNAAFAPCLAPALEAFTRSSRIAAVFTVGEPDPPQGADVVVGDDAEMTRLLEGGAAPLATAFDLGEVPWVWVVPPGSPAGALSLGARDAVAVLGGKAGTEARVALGRIAAGPRRVDVTEDAAVLRSSPSALVPHPLAGEGERRLAAVRPLVAPAAMIRATPRPAAARALLSFLASDEGRRALRGCVDPVGATAAAATVRPARAGAGSSAADSRRAGAPYAERVADWWLPECSLSRNRYNEPGEVLGPPNARNLGGD
ncbi:MAG TPA: hypothetical protein VMR21_05720, partial [Vicinamibacteria bacterium]|nr:hypothetical protein [Vicinamibacteria bacterium]